MNIILFVSFIICDRTPTRFSGCIVSSNICFARILKYHNDLPMLNKSKLRMSIWRFKVPNSTRNSMLFAIKKVQNLQNPLESLEKKTQFPFIVPQSSVPHQSNGSS